MCRPLVVSRFPVGSSPSSVDLPLPEGPTIARNSPRRMSSVSGWRIVSGSLPLMTVLETSTSSIMVSDNRLEDRPDVVGHDARTLGRRMDAVALIERLAAGDPIEKERHERDVILLCERGIHLMKLHDVCAAEIRRRLHAGQYDGDSTGLRALNERPQV